jgi:TonB-dependent receptor
MLSRVFILFSFILLTGGVFAQVGTIKGNVKDATTGEGIVSANVFVLGTTQGTVADIDGNFEITKVKTGKYSLVISFISYKTDTLKNISVYADQITVINTSIVEESQQLSEVVVSGQRMRDTDISIISDIKTSQLIVSGISAQQISLSQDRDAAQVVKRIPGVTILNNKFVNVRGLSERYSVVLLNGVIAPSTEVDSRAFAFDLIPSSMIDRMLVYKSGGADLPGDFAGAVINISTKSVVDENSLSINFTGGFRAGTTFRNFISEKGSSTDWLGSDNGYRDLPNNFPQRNLSTYDLSFFRNRQIVGEAGANLNQDWVGTQGKVIPDLRTTINFSRSINIGKMRLGNITSLSLSNARQRLQQQNYYYEGYSQPNTKVGRRFVYFDNRDATTARVGVISNFSLEITPSHIIEFRNFFNQQGNSQVTSRTGIQDVQNFEVINKAINYTERSIYAGQLGGRHSFSERLSLTWAYGYSQTSANQPDYRRIGSQRPIGSNDPFSIVATGSGNAADGRFFSKLNETVHSQILNIDYKLNPSQAENQQAKISMGYYGSQTARDFNARLFSYTAFTADREIDPSFYQVGFNDIYKRENLIGANDGPDADKSTYPVLKITEGTNPSDSYTAANLYTAGYLNFYKSFNMFKATVGTRVEYNRQQLNSIDTNGDVVKVDNPLTNVLPFVNLSYNFTPKNLLRASYSKTLNRPNFRELAPFNYFDFDRNANTFGFDSLKIATIDNVDLRFEHYPSANENISIGVFYKHFINPIETRLVPGSNIIYSFMNAQSATSFGAELDLRKSLQGISNSAFMDKISILFNAALIHSKVILSEKASNQDKERAMQGQSPYIINAGVNYADVENGLQVNVAYNVFGKRIFAIGDFNQQSGVAQNPTQYEMPRNQIDLTVSKDFGQHFNIKLGIQDILNQKYRLVQDSNSDREITGFDDPIQLFRPGQYVTFGVTYRIN